MQHLPFLFGGYVTLPRERLRHEFLFPAPARKVWKDIGSPFVRFGESRCWKMVSSRGEVEPLTEKTLTLADNYFSRPFSRPLPTILVRGGLDDETFQTIPRRIPSMRVLSRV